MQSPVEVTKDLNQQLAQMVSKLGQDFHFNPPMKRGYAILTYTARSQGLRAIIAEVQRHY
jgi:hypothetical protein